MNDIGKPLVNDEYCLSKIKEGDEHFFNLIFEKYRNQLFAYLYKVTKSKELSEEIVLDVFLKLWHGREAITEIQNFEAFLYKVAHNKAIDFFRAAKRSQALQQALWQAITEAPAADNADNRLIFKNTDALIKEAINQLSPQRKKVFELRHYEDLSYAEIAATLNLSSHTVRNHLAASLQFIREYLEKNNALLLLLAIYFEKK
ncbi:RNA polymerase sigma-70 factor [Lacibacter sp. H375]|uniref:RNA polymerase sigma factor n=1 Tax=Lacibacter sp. H375 TaxID=3133424 RepID=UPI0030C2B801